MRTINKCTYLILTCVLLPMLTGPAISADSPDTSVNAQRVVAPPDIPIPRMDKDGKPSHMLMHKKFIGQARKGNVDLLLLGDSITGGWRHHQDIYTNAFGIYRPGNFGEGGDGTQHVLWRIQNGELEGLSPRVVMLLIGTNNSGSSKPEEIAAGIAAIVRTLQEKVPASKILLLGIMPRAGKTSPLRETIRLTNDRIARLADGTTIRYLDMTGLFLQPDGSFTKGSVQRDSLHLAAEGYRIWARAVAPVLAEMMQ